MIVVEVENLNKNEHTNPPVLVDKDTVFKGAYNIIKCSKDIQEEYAAHYGQIIRKLKDLVEEVKDLHTQCTLVGKYEEAKKFYEFISIYNKNIAILVEAYNVVVNHLRTVEKVYTYCVL